MSSELQQKKQPCYKALFPKLRHSDDNELSSTNHESLGIHEKYWYVSGILEPYKESQFTTTLFYPLNQIFRFYITQEFERFQPFIDSILGTLYLTLWAGIIDPNTIPLRNTFIVDASFLQSIKEYSGIIPLVIGNCLQVQLIVELKKWNMGYPIKRLCTKIIMIPTTFIH